MGKGLEPEQELKIDNSHLLNNVALMLFPAIVVVVGLALQYRFLGPGFWWLSGGAAVVLAASMFSGGLGISRLRRTKTNKFSLFNLQAILVVVGFLLLVITCLTCFVLGEEKTTDNQKHLDENSWKIGFITEELSRYMFTSKSLKSVDKHSNFDRKVII